MNNANEYFCSDLGLAVVLSMKCNLKYIDKSNPRRMIFVFENSSELEEVLDRYWKHQIEVEPVDFLARLKSMKTRMYENDAR